MKPEEWKGRYALLAFDSLIGFGCYYNVDVPSALQADLQGQQILNCTGQPLNASCCKECLGLGPDHYNQLYSVHSWMNAVFALPAGYIIDRIGNRVAGLMTTILSCIGSLLFLFSTFPGIRRTSMMFPLMITGRILLGAATGSTLIVQDRIITFWFRDRLVLAMGIIFSALRMSNVSNFLITAHVQRTMGIAVSLWIGFGMCCMAALAAVGVFFCDRAGSQRLDETLRTTPKAALPKLRTILSFPYQYWLVCLGIMTFYSSFLPFIANGSKFIQDNYGYSKEIFSYINGVPYDVAVVISPFIGYMFTKINLDGICLVVVVLIFLPVFPLFAYCQYVYPLILMVLLGFCCTAGGLLLWSSVIHVVPFTSFGTASGIITFIQGLGVGLTNLAIGKIFGSVENPDLSVRIERYHIMLILLSSLLGICLILVVFINIKDKDRKFNRRLRPAITRLECFVNERTPLLAEGSIN